MRKAGHLGRCGTVVEAGCRRRGDGLLRRAVVLGVASALTASISVSPAQASLVPPAEETTLLAPETCEDPHPCGLHWPTGLTGPFEAEQAIHPISIVRPDEVVLQGWYKRPKVPPGTRVPVLLSSSPYLNDQPTPGQPEWWSATSGYPVEDQWGVPPKTLVEQGFAVAMFAVRGTASSGGCNDLSGPLEQADQVALVEWAASQPWSNRRVAMGGRSYMAWTAQQAAIHSPKALKTVVVTAPVSDPYTLFLSQQGAPGSSREFLPVWLARVSWASPTDPAANRALPERLCPEVAEMLAAMTGGWATDQRVPSFWEERRLIDRHPDIKAAVLLASGLRDGGLHQNQDTYMWQSLWRAPKRAIHGYWGHEYPNKDKDQKLFGEWQARLLPWLDYWLKGVGAEPDTGIVDYEVAPNVGVNLSVMSPPRLRNGRLLRSATWPPREATDEVLYLAERALQPAVAQAPSRRSFLSAYDPAADFASEEDWETDIEERAQDDQVSFRLWPALCTPEAVTVPGAAPGGLAYLSAPLAEDVVLAGNPFLSLHLDSTQPGGLIAASLISIAPNFDCANPDKGEGVHVLAHGAADLRFHASGYVAKDFDTSSASQVRVDLWDLSEEVPTGSRIGVVLSYGTQHSSGQPYTPLIGINASENPATASQVVLPVVEGTLGGSKPKVEYPPVPFVPQRQP